MKLKITIAILFMCIATNIFSQTTGEHCVAFNAKIDDSVGIDISEQQEKTLISKLNQILTRNNASTTSLYNGFALSAQINIISEESLSTGIRPINVINAEITLITSNIVDNSNYGSLTLETKATANSQEQALTAIINSIRPTDPRITKFMSNAIKRITDYYTMNMPIIIQKTEVLMAGNKYNEAMIFLESIPTCVPAYEQSSEAIQELYKIIASKSCNIAISMANRYIAVEDYESAREILLKVSPESDCNGEIEQMLIKLTELIKENVEVADTRPESVPTKEVVPVTVPETAPVATPKQVTAPVTTSSETLSNPFGTFDIKLLSCKGDVATNIVTIEMLVKNITDLAQYFAVSRYDRNILMYNSEGDEFRVKGMTNNEFNLRPDMSRKFTISFDRVPAKNKIIHVTINCRDGNASKYGIIDIKNMTVSW